MKSGIRDRGSGIRDLDFTSSSRAASAACCARWRAGARFIRRWPPAAASIGVSSRHRPRACRPRRAPGHPVAVDGPAHHHDGRPAESRGVAAGVRRAAAERRCLHGHRRRVGARGDAGAGPAPRRGSRDRGRRVRGSGARRTARLVPRRLARRGARTTGPLIRVPGPGDRQRRGDRSRSVAARRLPQGNRPRGLFCPSPAPGRRSYGPV